jgi:hypothetical protein
MRVTLVLETPIRVAGKVLSRHRIFRCEFVTTESLCNDATELEFVRKFRCELAVSIPPSLSPSFVILYW